MMPYGQKSECSAQTAEHSVGEAECSAACTATPVLENTGLTSTEILILEN